MSISSPVRIWREAAERFKLLGKKGKIVAFTRVFSPPKGFVKQKPYWVAVIKLGNSKKITGQLVVEGKEPEIKQKVIGVLRRIRVADKKSIIEYGVKFKVISKK